MFSIQCGSCQAKLKVSKLALIGQTLGCPKCGAMVVVTPPPNWQPPAEAAPASKSSESAQSSKSSPSPPPAHPRPKSQQKPARPSHPKEDPADLQETLPNAGDLGWGDELKLADLEPDSEPTSPAGPDPAAAIAATRSRAPSSHASRSTAEPVLQAAQWDSVANRRKRTILLTVVGSVGLLLIVSALGFYLWEQNSRATRNRVTADGGQAPLEKVGDPVSADDGAASGGRQDSEPTRSQPTPDSDSIPDPSDLAGNPGPDPAGMGQQNEPQTRPSDPRVAESAAAEDPENEPLPADFQAGVGGPSDANAAGSFDDVMSRIFGAPELTSEWDDPELRAWQQGATDPIDAVLRDLARQVPTRRPSARVVKPAPRQVDVQRSLTAKLAGFRNPQTRLPQLMATVESLSSLPVWLDIARYQGNPISLDDRHLVEAVQVTLPELLDAHLGSFGFSYETYAWNPQLPDVLGLRLYPTGSEQVLLESYRLPWIAAEAEAEVRQSANENWAAWVRTYLAPDSWGEWLVEEPEDLERQQASGLGGIRVIEDRVEVAHLPHMHRKLQRFLRQLQQLKENGGQPQPWPADLLPVAVQEGPRWQTIITMSNYEPTPLRDLFRTIYEQSDVTVLVDWPSLIEDGWTPDTAIPLVARNRTVENVLRELCLDMQLSLRLLAPDVVCLLSDSAEERLSDLEVYPIADLVGHPREWPVFRGRLRRLLEQEFSRYPSAYVFYDAEFACLVARLPQSSHQRLQTYLDAARRP